MRQAKIFYDTILAGKLIETDDGYYTYQYNEEYIVNYPKFEGLIPEGWLLEIATKNWKINPNDRMGLLLACCQNCIGAVSVEPIMNQDYE